ncbi:MAG: hypothetical protein ACE5HU_07810 [Acidobacteriota bacterium]
MANTPTGNPIGRPGTDPIVVLGLEFGRFPEASPLNPRFCPGRERLKLTVEVRLDGPAPLVAPAEFLEALQGTFPSLCRHHCCGDHHLREIFAGEHPPPACALRDTDPATDVAHLLEHLIIDFQYFIAAMQTCSGITCGYESPRNRFDIFIETPDRRVSRLAIDLATPLLASLLRGASIDPILSTAIKLARSVHANRSRPITRSTASQWLAGDRNAPRALTMLHDLRFIEEIAMNVNFSRIPLYRMAPEGGIPSPR